MLKIGYHDDIILWFEFYPQNYFEEIQCIFHADSMSQYVDKPVCVQWAGLTLSKLFCKKHCPPPNAVFELKSDS